MPSSTIPTLLVFVVAPVLIWWLRKSRHGTTLGLKVAARTALTRNGVVAVVESDGRRFLIGATDHGINLLAELSGLDLEPSLTEELEEPAMEDFLASSPTGSGKSPIDALRAMTVRKPPRSRNPHAHRPT